MNRLYSRFLVGRCHDYEQQILLLFFLQTKTKAIVYLYMSTEPQQENLTRCYINDHEIKPAIDN